MDNESHYAEPPDLTSQVTIIEQRPKFVGNYSFVHLGKYRGEMVAIKILKFIHGSTLHAMRRKFARERAIWALLSHPNIVPFIGYADDEKLYGEFGALVSPWYELGDAAGFLRTYGDDLDQSDRVILWRGVVAGVAYLHCHNPSIVHGDLKPGNILIDAQHTPKICDFGLATIYHEDGGSGLTTTSEYIGTERYLAYELVLGEGECLPTMASDVWSLGCIGLEFVYKQLPYASRKNNRFGQIVSDIGKGILPAAEPDWSLLGLEDTALWRIISECWTPEVQIRPSSTSVLETLDNLHGGYTLGDESQDNIPVPLAIPPLASPILNLAKGSHTESDTNSVTSELKTQTPNLIPAPTLMHSPTSFSATSEASVMSLSTRMLPALEPPTPPFTSDDQPMSDDDVRRILEGIFAPWQSNLKGDQGILSARKIVELTEEGKWKGDTPVDAIAYESAHWKLIRAQRLWSLGIQELFKLDHPSGLPDIKQGSLTKYMDGGAPLRAVETMVQSVLLDSRVIDLRTADTGKNLKEQLAWQFHADADHTKWINLSQSDYDLDNVFAEAESSARLSREGLASTRIALASYIRNHVILGATEEAEGWTQAAVIRYGRALDIIDWVKETLGLNSPEAEFYGNEDRKRSTDSVFEGPFGRDVQIRLGLTLISQYNYVKRDPTCSWLRQAMLAEILAGADNLSNSLNSTSANLTDHLYPKIDEYISSHVYHVAYAHLLKAFYCKENAKVVTDIGKPGAVDRAAVLEFARARRVSSTFAYAQAALLFPEDEEKRIHCFEMALEEILKIGGVRVGEAITMFESIKEGKNITDELWNCPEKDGMVGQEDIPSTSPEDESTAARLEGDNNQKNSDRSAFSGFDIFGLKRRASKKKWRTIGSLSSPKPPSRTIATSPTKSSIPLMNWSPQFLLLDNWFTTLQRTLDQKRITRNDILRGVPNLRGKIEIEWDGNGGYEDEGAEDIKPEAPAWARWGMKKVEMATKRGSMTIEMYNAGGIVDLAKGDQACPWVLVTRLAKKPLFVVDTSLFDSRTDNI